jgi:hypothetical protein
VRLARTQKYRLGRIVSLEAAAPCGNGNGCLLSIMVEIRGLHRGTQLFRDFQGGNNRAAGVMATNSSSPCWAIKSASRTACFTTKAKGFSVLSPALRPQVSLDLFAAIRVQHQ